MILIIRGGQLWSELQIKGIDMRACLIILSFLMVACAQVRVKTLIHPTTDFSKYQSWCWLQGCEVAYDGPGYLYDSATIEAVANAVALEMHEKGYTQEDENADLLVDFHIVLKEDSAIFSMVHEEDLPFCNNNEQEFYHFLRGSLIIHIGDRESGQMIWRSDARRLMALRPDIDEGEIRNGVKKSLKKFPVKATEGN